MMPSFQSLMLLSFLIYSSNAAAQSQECGVYLAKSTIPNAGLGMFAGRAYRHGDEVLDGDLMVPLEEVDWNNGHTDDWQFVWDDYTWHSGQFDFADEETDDPDDLSMASFGLGAAMNSLLPLVNVDGGYTSSNYAGLHRSKDPGIGAFTPYHGRTSIATRDIQKGEELFVSYGSHYFRTRNRHYGYIPFEKDFVKADTIIHKFLDLEKKLQISGVLASASETTTSKLIESLWDLTSNKLSAGKTSRVLNALPANFSHVGYVAETGTAYLDYNRSFHSIEWLEENGKCMDNIRPGLSEIPQAGRGAFATRFIPKGGLVAPAPLIHIPQAHRLDIYGFIDKGDVQERDLARGAIRKQLLLNYCFGHSNSTMLLNSYGAMTNLINHSSKNPNARIVWSDLSPHPEWMNLTVDKMAKKGYAGLMFDYVALRDIQQGEEVLIDYGNEWETAWNNHIKNWKPPKDADRYTSGMELTDDPDATFWLNTEYPYYPPSMKIWVYGPYVNMAGVSISGRENVDFHLVRIVGRYKDKDGKYLYNAEVIQRKHESQQDTSSEVLLGVVFGLPSDAFYFEDSPYTRDHQMQSTFRHSMMIPDDMMPTAWMNVN